MMTYLYNNYIPAKQNKNKTLSIYYYYIRFSYKTSMKYLNHLYFSQSHVKYANISSIFLPFYFKVKSISQQFYNLDSLYSVKNMPAQINTINIADLTRLIDAQPREFKFQDYEISYSNFHFFYLNNLIGSINSNPMVFLAHSNFKVLNRDVFYKSARRKLDFKDKTYVVKITRNVTRKIKKQYTPLFKYRKLFKYLKFRPYLFQKSLMLNRFKKTFRFYKKRTNYSLNVGRRLLKYKLNMKDKRLMSLMHPRLGLNRMQISYRLRNYMHNFVRPSFMSFRDNNWRQLQLSVLYKGNTRKSSSRSARKYPNLGKSREKFKKNNIYYKNDRAHKNIALGRTRPSVRSRLKSPMPLILKRVMLRRKALLFFHVFKKYASILINNYNLSKIQVQLVYQFLRILVTSINVRSKVSAIKSLIDNNIPIKLIHDCLVILSIQQYRFYKKVYKSNRRNHKLFSTLYYIVKELLAQNTHITKAQLLLYFSTLLRKIKVILFKRYKNKLFKPIKHNHNVSSRVKLKKNQRLRSLKRALNKRARFIIRILKRVLMIYNSSKKVN